MFTSLLSACCPWAISCVIVLTNASRNGISSKAAWIFIPTCVAGYIIWLICGDASLPTTARQSMTVCLVSLYSHSSTVSVNWDSSMTSLSNVNRRLDAYCGPKPVHWDLSYALRPDWDISDFTERLLNYQICGDTSGDSVTASNCVRNCLHSQGCDVCKLLINCS